MKVVSYAIRSKKAYLHFASPSFVVWVVLCFFLKLCYSLENLTQMSGNGIHWPM